MGFACFMSSTTGRVLRAILGLVLLVGGLSLHATGGYVLAVIGLVPLAAGILDWCLIAKLMGLPFNGKEIRARCAQVR